jgi:glycosyltransferase involved in cell wall biosynthesis
MITETGGYEIVVVDDASTDDTVKSIQKWQKKFPVNIQLLKFTDHMERVVAMNAGFRAATGDWLMLLDSDDEMMSNFKQVFEKALDEHPRARLFNWGSVVQCPGKTKIREPFKPGIAPTGQTKVFKSGQIFSGGFIFEKKLLYEAGFLPDVSNPYSFGESVLSRYPELKPLYTLPTGEIRTDIGNPWGNDFGLFYALTRVSNPVTLDRLLHVTHTRP